MAIQFNCPYCTASIRVPDTAAGKQGTCPKCSTKLIVPKVGPAMESPEASPKKPSETQPQKAADAGSPDEVPEIPNIQTDSPQLGTEPSLARVVRKRSQRSQRKGTNPLIPIGLFGVVLGALVFWMWQPSGKLEGQLPAERLEEYEIPPGRVDQSAFELPADEVSTLLEEMKSAPPSGVLVRDGFDMQFRPDNKGLQVVIKKTSVTEVYRVKTSAAPALKQLIRNHSEELLDRQRAEYRKAARRFIEDWKTARENNRPLDMGAYHSSLGFNRLTGTTGFAVVAQIGARNYRAVHEDPNGDLYFLLPGKTEKFVLRGREFEDGTTRIPGHLTVKVKEPLSEKTPEKSPAPNEAEPAADPPMDAPETKTEPRDAS